MSEVISTSATASSINSWMTLSPARSFSLTANAARSSRPAAISAEASTESRTASLIAPPQSAPSISALPFLASFSCALVRVLSQSDRNFVSHCASAAAVSNKRPLETLASALFRQRLNLPLSRLAFIAHFWPSVRPASAGAAINVIASVIANLDRKIFMECLLSSLDAPIGLEKSVDSRKSAVPARNGFAQVATRRIYPTCQGYPHDSQTVKNPKPPPTPSGARS